MKNKELRNLIMDLFEEFKEKSTAVADSPDMYQTWVGQYVISRSYNEGVLFGRLKSCGPDGFVIMESRRLHYHKPWDQSLSWYEGVALSGLSEGCRISAPVDRIVVENYSLTLCSPRCISSILSYPTFSCGE